MSKTVDLELKKAFSELQQKMLETTQKLKLADIQIESLKRSQQHAQLTEKEISNNKNYLERNLKESENNLREMVQQRKEMPSEAS
ncbi:Prefoldin subunit 1 [Blattella germanica]|nr:Prefoldin subunit 1 [Blattella germanica]